MRQFIPPGINTKLVFLLIFVIVNITANLSESWAQVIRKNWQEMTTHEKEVYINALRALYTKSPNVIETYVNTHDNSTYVRHALPDFLLWHRMFIQYFEKELQNSGVANAANIALPYWGWDTPDNFSSSSPIFSSTTLSRGAYNLGLFGYPIPEGTFTREFRQSFAQPTSSDLQELVNSYPQFGTDYETQQGNRFWPILEATYHNWCHAFIGGTMSILSISPRDPVFYQHHCYVDKIWQDWHNVHGSSSVRQTDSINTIPGKPRIARSGVVDARSLKVWYASNGQVRLDRYTVSSTEKYRYTGTITVSSAVNPSTDAFTVPTNTNCTMVSGASITFNPGFSAQNGSVFSATIDPVSSSTSVFNTARQDFAFVGEEAKPEPLTDSQLQVFPNPSPGGRFTVALLTHAEIGYQYTIYDRVGKEVYQSRDGFKDKLFEVNLSDKPLGMYLLRLKTSDGKSYTKRLISN